MSFHLLRHQDSGPCLPPVSNGSTARLHRACELCLEFMRIQACVTGGHGAGRARSQCSLLYPGVGKAFRPSNSAFGSFDTTLHEENALGSCILRGRQEATREPFLSAWAEKPFISLFHRLNSACNFHIVQRGSDDTGHLFIEDALRGWIWGSTTQVRGCACLPVTQRSVCQTNTPEARSSSKHQFSSCATRVSQRTDFEEPSPKLGALRLGDTNLHSSFRLRSIGKIFIVTGSRFSS